MQYVLRVQALGRHMIDKNLAAFVEMFLCYTAVQRVSVLLPRAPLRQPSYAVQQKALQQNALDQALQETLHEWLQPVYVLADL
jgi:hypothetical protein